MDLQGINQAVLDQNSFGRDLENHNSIIREHNQKVLDTYNAVESSRKETGDVDDIWHGVADPLKTGFGLMALGTAGRDALNYEGGVSKYIADTSKSRAGAIAQGFQAFTGSEKEESLGAEPLSNAVKTTQARLNLVGPGQEGQDAFDIMSDTQKATLVSRYGAPSATNLTHLQNIKTDVQQTGGDETDVLSRAVTSAPPSAPPTTITGNTGAAPKPSVAPGGGAGESSLPTSIEDAAGRVAGKFGLGDEAAEAVGKITGKISGVAGGIYAGYEMAEGQDKTGLEKASGILEEVGAGLDILGTAIPILEPLGAVASTAGSLVGGISDYVESGKQAQTNLQTKNEGTEQVDVSQRSATGSVGGATKELQQQGGSYSF
tara:strand:- start:1595 stop:2719 length:1125 start_codon:yes stop_codon:yes gene_type:complete